MRMVLSSGSIILLALLALAACSGVEVAPNPTYPGYVGSYGPGGSDWMTGPVATSVR
jgi:hypothetical protein